VDADGHALSVPIAAIVPGDTVLVAPGERVCVDGIVTDGCSEVDQSLVTGETTASEVKPGARVYAGTLNISGALRIHVQAAGKDTLLDEIDRLMNQAVESRSRYVSLSDRAARLYAPVVHATALLTLVGWIALGLGWQPALIIAITVLIITCPCALGLAIPAVQVVAASALFRRKVMLKQGDALERLAEIDTVVFDKTGTLTSPEPGLLNPDAVPADHRHAIAELAAASRHPLALALARSFGAAAPANGARECSGLGLILETPEGERRLGSVAFSGAEHEARAVAAAHPGASLIAYRSGERRIVIALGQKLRPDARHTIDALRQMGFRLMMMSGDRAEAAAPVAEALGIEQIRAEVLPGEKLKVLEELSREGRKILMVGDGLNDAPALAGAHVSMSPISATHLAQAAADVVFLGDGLSPVLDSILIARRARHLMIQNLWFAVLYNAVAVPIAVLGLVTPLIAAAAMSGSSIVVTLNALRARWQASPASGGE
jgi:Cu2+-exporting ATPase